MEKGGDELAQMLSLSRSSRRSPSPTPIWSSLLSAWHKQTGKLVTTVTVKHICSDAIEIANKINLADPDLQTEANELCKYCRVINPAKLGADAEKLIRDNKATIVVVKDKDEGNYIVTVSIPQPHREHHRR